jgi:hypothetical protein
MVQARDRRGEGVTGRRPPARRARQRFGMKWSLQCATPHRRGGRGRPCNRWRTERHAVACLLRLRQAGGLSDGHSDRLRHPRRERH